MYNGGQAQLFAAERRIRIKNLGIYVVTYGFLWASTTQII